MENKDKENLALLQKHDRYMITANTALLVGLALIFGLEIVVAIMMFVAKAVFAGILMLIVSAVSTFLIYIIIKLVLSVVFDIKMIRNKLYGFENNSIYRLYDDKYSDEIKHKLVINENNSESENL